MVDYKGSSRWDYPIGIIQMGKSRLIIPFSSNSVHLHQHVMHWSQLIKARLLALVREFLLACVNTAPITELRAYITAQT